MSAAARAKISAAQKSIPVRGELAWLHNWPVSGRARLPVMADQKMLNQEIYFSLRFFLAFSGSKPTKAAPLASLQGRELSLAPQSV